MTSVSLWCRAKPKGGICSPHKGANTAFWHGVTTTTREEARGDDEGLVQRSRCSGIARVAVVIQEDPEGGGGVQTPTRACRPHPAIDPTPRQPPVLGNSWFTQPTQQTRHLRRWPNIEPAMGQHRAFIGNAKFAEFCLSGHRLSNTCRPFLNQVTPLAITVQ